MSDTNDGEPLTDVLAQAVSAKAKHVPVAKQPPTRTMATRVVREVKEAFQRLAAAKGKKPGELHRDVLYAYIEQVYKRKTGVK